MNVLLDFGRYGVRQWIQDGSPAHSGTPVKIDTLQFVPKNTNPKEFKKLQQQVCFLYLLILKW